MVKIITNTFISKTDVLVDRALGLKPRSQTFYIVPYKAKILAWYLFLVFFIENGTLGIIPTQYYMIYRAVRISDILIYLSIIYSLIYFREYEALYKSNALIIIKILFLYIIFQFIVSVVLYNQNIIEYFFRAKFLWYSFLIFPYLLLIKRNGLPYLARLIFPFAVVANVLYIISALTGIVLMPDTSIAKTNIMGFDVYRVYGGTFYGDVFFMYFIYHWLTRKFELQQLFFAVLFIIPQILAFGRAAWLRIAFQVIVMIIWNLLRKRNFRVVFRQIIVILVLIAGVFYSFTFFIPESDYLTEAVESRFVQGTEDYQNKEGTYASRLDKNAALLELWQKSNFYFGVGLHPMWVIKPVTLEEEAYYGAICDVNWPAILAVYGITGFGFATMFQVIFLIISFKVIRKNQNFDVYMFFAISLFCTLFFDTFIYFTTSLLTFTLWGFWTFNSFLIAATVHKYEELKSATQ